MARFRYTFFATLVLLITVPFGFAETNWPVPREASHEPNPFRYDPARWKTVPKDFLDDASACVLHSATINLVEADGTIETISHEVTRFNSRKAIEKLGEYKNIVYTPAYQKLTLNEARVHKADGRTVAIEPKHVLLRDVTTDYQVFDPDKQLVISFPTLEVGDVIEVKWTVRGKNPEHQGQFFTRYNFGDDTNPVVEDELVVRAPKALALKYATTGGKVEPKITDDEQTRTYHWSTHDKRQLSQDGDMPSKEEFRTQVSVSSFASWDDVARWKQKLRADCWECTADVRKIVQQVTKDCKTPVEKARALTYWLRRNIRYVSAGERHDYTPHPPSTVVGNRFGDCKDTSQLLAVMLKEAGIDVALATLGVLDDGQVVEEVPSPWGTHAILVATIEGQQHWIDTTLSLGGWDFLPRSDRDRLCYVSDQKGIRLVRTPGLRPEENRTEMTTHVWIGADGSSRNERASQYFGSAALSQRDAWFEEPAGERRRLAANDLQDANNKSHLVRLNIDEKSLRDLDAPVRSEVVFEIPGHFSGETEREGNVTDSRVWSKLLAYTLDYDRSTALDLWAPFESKHTFVFHLPPGYRVDGPPRSHTARSPWGSFTLKVKDNTEKRELTVEMHTRLEKWRVDPEKFAEFRKWQDDVSKHYRVWLTLKPSSDLADAAALETILALMPDDSAAALTLGRIYAENDRRADARRVLRRTLGYHPKDETLWEQVIKASENLKDEEAIYRELTERFPDDPKYPLALAGNLNDQGAHAEARKVLEKLTKSDEGAILGLAHLQMARGYLAENDARAARRHLDAAKKADPSSITSGDGGLLAAKIYEKTGDRKEAALQYAVVTLAKEQFSKDQRREALLGLARVRLSEETERRQGLADLREYVVESADDAEGLENAAELYLGLGRMDDALDLARKALETDKSERPLKLLGLIYQRRGEYALAVDHLSPLHDDSAVLEARLLSRLALGQLARAEEDAARADRLAEPTVALKKISIAVGTLTARKLAVLKGTKITAAREAAGNEAVGAFVCAEYLQRQGRPAAEIDALLAKASVEGVEIGPLYGLRALRTLERGQLTKALPDAEKAIALAPDDALGYLVRGRIRLERAQDGGLVDLKKAAELSRRKDAEVLHWLAAALSRAGQLAEALAAQQEAVKLAPANADLRAQLQDLEKQSKGG
jgi:tetratricopeptide (TPR) repeat protein